MMSKPAYLTVRGVKLKPFDYPDNHTFKFPTELGVTDFKLERTLDGGHVIGAFHRRTYRLTFIDADHAAEFALRYA